METWSSISSGITSILTTAGITRLPENQDVEQAVSVHENNYYSLKPLGLSNTELTSNGGLGSYVVRLEITFINLTSSARDTNFDTFVSVVNSIIQLPRFMGFSQEGSFEDLDNKKSKATLTFNYGLRDC